MNDSMRNIYEDAALNNSAENILKTMAKKEFNEGENDLKTKEVQTFNNADESFSMGIWESTQANIPSDWPYDEFMYVI